MRNSTVKPSAVSVAEVTLVQLLPPMPSFCCDNRAIQIPFDVQQCRCTPEFCTASTVDCGRAFRYILAVNDNRRLITETTLFKIRTIFLARDAVPYCAVYKCTTANRSVLLSDSVCLSVCLSHLWIVLKRHYRSHGASACGQLIK